MNNFSYYNPTRIVFGKGSIAEIADLVPTDCPVLLTYGGGSIQRNGVYEQVLAALGNRQVFEFGGIQPNPKYETLMDAVDLVRRENVGFILAVGGGSVVDGSKFIAAAALYEGDDPWQLVAQRMDPGKAVPLGVVLTLPATGSEMNRIAVISSEGSQEKLAFLGDSLFPRFSVLDPTTTFSLPPRQIRNGCIDAFVHVVEQYITYAVNAPLQDRQAEAILATLVEEAPKTLADPKDYDARANVMWCASQALNGLIQAGVPTDFATHRIGHELTAFYGIDHAESLAALVLQLWRHERDRKIAKLAQYARRVWGVSEPDDAIAADAAIACTERFFNSLGMPTRLAEFGIDSREAGERISARARQRGATFGEHSDITPEQVAVIIAAC